MSDTDSRMIQSPPHYTRGQIEVWDFIADQKLDYFTGNVVKYVCRAGFKGEKLEDLKKARAYIDKLISIEEEKRDLRKKTVPKGYENRY